MSNLKIKTILTAVFALVAFAANDAKAETPTYADPLRPGGGPAFGESLPEDTEVVFSWEDYEEEVTEDNQATWYYVYVQKDGVFWWGKWIEGDKFWATEYPFPEGEYRWWVRGWNSDGYGPWGFEGNFLVGDLVKVTGPEHTGYPEIFFNWTSVSEDPNYEVYIRRNGQLIHNEVQSDSSYSAPAENGTYDIWVRVVGGTWSAQFTQVVYMLDPVYDMVSNLEFGIVPVEGATWFRLWIGDYSTGEVVVVYDEWVEGQSVQYLPASLFEENGFYECYVQSWAPTFGYGAWSPVLYYFHDLIADEDPE